MNSGTLNGQAEMSWSQNAISAVFQEREKFLVIGLTGRIGSGCSTVCEILQTPVDNLKFEHIEPPEKDKKDLSFCNRQRQERIIEHFASAGHWQPFNVIKVRDILTSFILDDKGLEGFDEIVSKVFESMEGEVESLRFCTRDRIESNLNLWAKKNRQELKENDFEEANLIQTILLCNKNLWEEPQKHHSELRSCTKFKDFYYFTSILPYISGIIQAELKKINPFLYTRIYQNLGNIVRTYGGLTTCTALTAPRASAIFSVARRINLGIKLFRNKDWYLNQQKIKLGEWDKSKADSIPASPVRIVIDSIKNIFEATYLRDRYSAFYLLAVSADDTKRYSYLKEKGLRPRSGELQIIDYCEQPSVARKVYKKYVKESEKKAKCTDIGDFFLAMNKDEYFFQIWKNAYNDGTYTFNLQDVEACIRNADIFINNSKTVHDLTKAIVRYVCLMMHPGLVQPTGDERCMQIAQAAKLNSGCISRQVGAVVCDKDTNILSIGWNQPPATPETEVIPCGYRCFPDLYYGVDIMAYSKFERTDMEYRNHLYQICPKSNEYTKMQEWNKLLEGLPLTFCFKDLYCDFKSNENQVHTRSQHGEEIALENCSRERTVGGTLYTTSCSCELCSKKALHYGISRMVYVEPYPGISEAHILGFESSESSGMQSQMQVELFTGACHRAYTQLYTPLFPLKDEILMRGVGLLLEAKVEGEAPPEQSVNKPHNGAF